jgi:hypothetical protein
MKIDLSFGLCRKIDLVLQAFRETYFFLFTSTIEISFFYVTVLTRRDVQVILFVGSFRQLQIFFGWRDHMHLGAEIYFQIYVYVLCGYYNANYFVQTEFAKNHTMLP